MQVKGSVAKEELERARLDEVNLGETGEDPKRNLLCLMPGSDLDALFEALSPEKGGSMQVCLSQPVECLQDVVALWRLRQGLVSGDDCVSLALAHRVHPHSIVKVLELFFNRRNDPKQSPFLMLRCGMLSVLRPDGTGQTVHGMTVDTRAVQNTHFLLGCQVLHADQALFMWRMDWSSSSPSSESKPSTSESKRSTSESARSTLAGRVPSVGFHLFVEGEGDFSESFVRSVTDYYTSGDHGPTAAVSKARLKKKAQKLRQKQPGAAAGVSPTQTPSLGKAQLRCFSIKGLMRALGTTVSMRNTTADRLSCAAALALHKHLVTRFAAGDTVVRLISSRGSSLRLDVAKPDAMATSVEHWSELEDPEVPKPSLSPAVSSSTPSLRRVPRHKPKATPTACAHCGILKLDQLRCSRCRRSFYCGQKCQMVHWPLHRLACVV